MTEEASKFTRVNAIGRCMVSPVSYKDRVFPSGYRTPTAKQIAEYALRQLEEARAKDVAQHEANAPFIDANCVARERITMLMNELGVPKTYQEIVPSRSRYPKRATKDAGYIGDMARNFPTDDGFALATQNYQRLVADYQKYAADAEKEDERAKQIAAQAEEQAKAERRANIELVQIILRYGLNEDSDWPEVLEALRKRDQRLDLAVAMAQTRGDWSESPYRVSAALDRFTITTDEDKDIANDVVSCLVDFEDGRVFRDTRWNYGVLFASVADQQLSADVQAAMSRAAP